MSHHNMVPNPIPMPKAITIPAAKIGERGEWNNFLLVEHYDNSKNFTYKSQVRETHQT